MPQHPKSPPIFPYPWASSWGEDQYGLWMGLDYNGVQVVFRWIEPGSFMMGSSEDEKWRYDDEEYQEVTLPQGFWLAEAAVTQALWEAVMSDNPSRFKGKDLPVETVSWDDCQVFLEKMSGHHPELALRLPWEAEWEYACRAGTETAFNFGSELSLNEVHYTGLWKYNDDNVVNSLRKTIQVKSYPCNAWGLYEMHGNVWEWCQDDYDEREKGARRMFRGGSWDDDGMSVRSACRGHDSPDGRDDSLGLRISLV